MKETTAQRPRINRAVQPRPVPSRLVQSWRRESEAAFEVQAFFSLALLISFREPLIRLGAHPHAVSSFVYASTAFLIKKELFVRNYLVWFPQTRQRRVKQT